MDSTNFSNTAAKNSPEKFLALEKVSEGFDPQILEEAQSKTWQVLDVLSTKIEEGMTEEDAHQVAKELFKEYGNEKNWHPTKIRFGKNTLKTFREFSEPGVKLGYGDIFFLDIGCVFMGYEGDCGKTFILGENNEARQMIVTCEQLFDDVAEYWKQQKVNGHKLYEFAAKEAEERGYILTLEGGSGHRVSEFPHAIYHKGQLKDFDYVPSPHRWILEIQLRHPTLPMGAFYEDILV